MQEGQGDHILLLRLYEVSTRMAAPSRAGKCLPTALVVSASDFRIVLERRAAMY